ncbi:MAG TPA: serine protease, partial [Pararhizobium sp.]|nr:serine protease [Pararhizobium sp.]
MVLAPAVAWAEQLPPSPPSSGTTPPASPPQGSTKAPPPTVREPTALQPQGPASVADLAAKLLDAVVNISSSQTVSDDNDNVAPPQLPEGSPFQDFFDDFFNG